MYDVTSESLKAQIGLIPQDIMLFNRTIMENIQCAKESCYIAEIENAAKIANIHTFIDSLPNKYQTMVSDRGIKLSGGPRQRIAIARAILKNAPILVLDEATSSLDTLTESEIQQSINILLQNSNITVIVIAHRLSTIKHMDKIVVLENRQIVEKGDFLKLLNKKKVNLRNYGIINQME